MDTIFNVNELNPDQQNLLDKETKRNAGEYQKRVQVVKRLSVYSQVELAQVFDFF